MPSYNSKSQKRSKNSKNSKSGGRRRKHTMRKYRRGKKVMRGGENVMTYGELANKMGDFGGEFEFVFGESWPKYLSSIGRTENDTVDVDVLKQNDKWKNLSQFKIAFPQ